MSERYRRRAQRVWHNQRHTLGRRQGWRCAYCHVAVQCPTCHRDTETPATIDHVVRIRDGGGHDIRNTVLACTACQQWKDNPPHDALTGPLADQLRAWVAASITAPDSDSDSDSASQPSRA